MHNKSDKHSYPQNQHRTLLVGLESEEIKLIITGNNLYAMLLPTFKNSPVDAPAVTLYRNAFGPWIIGCLPLIRTFYEIGIMNCKPQNSSTIYL